MLIDNCFELGYVSKVHGLAGEVVATLDVDYPEDYKKLESVFVEENNNLVPFFITTIRIKKEQAIIRFEEIDSLDKAQELKGCKLFLPLDFLPTLTDEQFYFHEIIGYTVIDKNHEEIGRVDYFNSSSAQTIMVVNHQEKEILIPVTDEIIKKVNRDKKVVFVQLPEGLIDIYLGD